MNKPIVAIIYDFDKTLCTKDMQEYGFIDSLGMSPEAFWGETKALTDAQEMDGILAYMYMMVEKAREKHVPITREVFRSLGEKVEYFDGVLNWFERINRIGEQMGVEVEHYIVSSGVKEIIEGTPIAAYFKKIYACEFMYDENGTIQWPKLSVNYSVKVQFIFRINKGVLTIDTKSAAELNRFTPEDKRRVPFRNMIYIGDGLTDVPSMKVVKTNGGQSIAVYDPMKGKEAAAELLSADRVNFIAPADYRQGGELETVVRAIMWKIQAVESMMQVQS